MKWNYGGFTFTYTESMLNENDSYFPFIYRVRLAKDFLIDGRRSWIWAVRLGG